MRTLTALAACALAAATFATPAHAAATGAVLTCGLTIPAFGSGGGTCNLVGVAGGNAWALAEVGVDLYSVVGSLCMATGAAQGHFGAPVNADFNWTWVGGVGTVTLSGGTTGVGTSEMVLLAGNPCFSPTMQYAVVFELAGI